MPQRLLELRKDLLSLLELYQPDVVAVEKIFFSLNAKTAIQVAQARGVILSTTAEYKAGVEIVEYTPPEVKRIVTGNGQAKKPWIISAVENKLGVKVKDDNTADALAIAMTYAKVIQGDSGSDLPSSRVLPVLRR